MIKKIVAIVGALLLATLSFYGGLLYQQRFSKPAPSQTTDKPLANWSASLHMPIGGTVMGINSGQNMLVDTGSTTVLVLLTADTKVRELSFKDRAKFGEEAAAYARTGGAAPSFYTTVPLSVSDLKTGMLVVVDSADMASSTITALDVQVTAKDVLPSRPVSQ